MGLFEEEICEVEADGHRYVLRKNEAEARRLIHRLEDKLSQLQIAVENRNEKVRQSLRCQPQAGLHRVQHWIDRYRLSG